MAYKRKTKDCYVIEGNCGYGWYIECNCEDYADAKALHFLSFFYLQSIVTVFFLQLQKSMVHLYRFA